MAAFSPRRRTNNRLRSEPTSLKPVAPLLRPAHFIVAVAVSTAILSSLPARTETAPMSATAAPNPWQSFIDEAAVRFAIPASWIRAVMRVESRGDVKAVSPKGAIGLMQIMPDTYAELRTRYGLGTDPADPHDNILAGAAYLREMRERFGSAGFIAAYNAGPQRYEDYLATGRPLPDETQAYVAELTPLLSGASLDETLVGTRDRTSWRQSPLFVARPSDQSADNHSAFAPQPAFVRSDRVVADLSALVPLSGRLFVGKR
jgi:soluble lytic murein transglycosylase-like protein